MINARIDSCLSSSFPDKSKAIGEAAVRAKAYVDSGADCIYPIGPGDEATVRMLRDRIRFPINILASPAAASLSVLREIGINRVSFGPFIFRSCLKKFVDIVEGLDSQEDYACLREAMTSAEVNQYLVTAHE